MPSTFSESRAEHLSMEQDEASSEQPADNVGTTSSAPEFDDDQAENKVPEEEQALVKVAPDASAQSQSGWSIERAHRWTDKASKGLTAASLAQQAGFVAAKAGTRVGLGIARFATKASLTLPAMAVDAAMGTVPVNPWSSDPTSRNRASVAGAAGWGVDALFNFVDTITHGSIGVGEKLSELGIAATQSGVDQLKTALSADVVRSLATFARLIKTEWGVTTDERLPPGGLPAFDNVTIARALLCWISLQAVHRPQMERDMLSEMTLVRQSDFAQPTTAGQTAGNASTETGEVSDSRALSAAHRVQRLVTHARLMLAVYGGAFMLLLDQHPDGIRSLPSATNEAVLFVKDCVTRGSSIWGGTYRLPRLPRATAEGESYYRDEPHQDYTHPSSWNTDGIPYAQLLQGRFDDSLLHVAAGVDPDKAVRGSYDTLDKPPTEVEIAPEDLDQEEAEVYIGEDGVPKTTSRPRYYVITSAHNRKITLVLRGTVTAGDVATDLTCRAVSAAPLGGHLPPGSKAHEGVMHTALALGLPGRPLHAAVWKQVAANPEFDIELVGHSLGAGVVAALSLLWADPSTGQTLHSIERAGRRVSCPSLASEPGATNGTDGGLSTTPSDPRTRALHAFAYACPPTFDPVLAEYCKPIVTAFVCNHDLVPRLSMQSVLGIRNAIAWICYWDTEAQRQAQDHNSPASSPLTSTAALPTPTSSSSSIASESVSGTSASTLPASNTASYTASYTYTATSVDRAPTADKCPVRDFSTLTLLRKTLEHQGGRLGGPFTRARVDFERDVSKLYDALRAKAPSPELAIPGRVFATYDRNALLVPPPSFSATSGETRGAPGSGVSPSQATAQAQGEMSASSESEPTASSSTTARADKPERDVQARIYEVTGSRTNAFGQILFCSGMLESHFPRIYARVLTQLLDVPVSRSIGPFTSTTPASGSADAPLGTDGNASAPPADAQTSKPNVQDAIDTAAVLATVGSTQADLEQLGTDSAEESEEFHDAHDAHGTAPLV